MPTTLFGILTVIFGRRLCGFKQRMNLAILHVVELKTGLRRFFVLTLLVCSSIATTSSSLFAKLECIDKRFWTVVKNCGSFID